jgi:hypothetical protein
MRSGEQQEPGSRAVAVGQYQHDATHYLASIMDHERSAAAIAIPLSHHNPPLSLVGMGTYPVDLR